MVDDDVVARALERGCEDLLRLAAAAVDVSGVEEGDAHIEAFVDDGLGGFEVHATAEVVRAEPRYGNLQT